MSPGQQLAGLAVVCFVEDVGVTRLLELEPDAVLDLAQRAGIPPADVPAVIRELHRLLEVARATARAVAN